MNDLTFNILKIVVSVIAVLISVYVIPLLKAKLQETNNGRVFEMVEVAVRAAEQTITGSGMGAVKKEEVLEFVTNWMMAHGIFISQDQLDQLIECAVYNLKQEAR